MISSTNITHNDTPVKARLDISLLMDVQVDVMDHMYTNQLDSALHSHDETGVGHSTSLTSPIEQVFPLPRHFPHSFRGKSWAQVEQEDEEKIQKMIQQFRRQQFVCYFDSESLARYGKRRQKKVAIVHDLESDPEPSLDAEDQPLVVRRKKRLKGFRLASRCQTVKVSHATQTVQTPSVPQVHQQEESPASLPPSYCNVIMPLQRNTSLLYLLRSPDPSSRPPASGPKRSRKRRHRQDIRGLRLKYKPLPFQFYDLKSNRILPPQSPQIPPSGADPFRTPSPPPFQPTPLPCGRHLFRSPSPDPSQETLQPCVRRLFRSPSPSQQLPT